ncbi:MAG: hypothetical protein J6C05_09070 [Prevotella sp.]|nr:hypothetical protein [Prevotella sp.]MBO5157260.1 hypothetical protein [Prevotella sp.]
MRVSKVRGFLPAPEDGKDGISVELSTYAIAAKFREGTAAQAFTVTVSVLRGSTKIKASEFEITANGSGIAYATVATAGEYMRQVTINVEDGKTGAGTVTVNVKYENVTYTKIIAVTVTKDGAAGQDAYVLDLDNEMDSVPCNVQLQTNSPSNQVYTTLTLYKGATAIDMGTPTIVRSSTALGVELDSVSGHSKRYKITVYDDAGLTETVTFKVSAAGVTRNAVFTVNKIRPGIDGAPGSPGAAATIYRIEPSVTAAKISKDGTATPAYVKCKKTKQTGNGTPVETTDGYLCVRLSGNITDLSYSERYINTGVPVSGQSSIEFILYKSTTDKTVLDRETVPVVVDGTDGKPGNPGDDGNGIKSQTNYYIATTLKEGVTPSNPSSGWVAGVFQPPQALKPYAWRFTRTIYTKTGTVDSPCELIATFQGGTNPNLLDATTFESEDSIKKAWDVVNQYSATVSQENFPEGILTGNDGYQGRNAFRGGTRYSLESIRYKEILRQPILSKLKPSTWYTLSYWTRCQSDSLFYEYMTSHVYGFCRYKLYLQAAHTYYFQINGFVSAAAKSAGRTLRAYIYSVDSSDRWTWNTYLEIDNTASEMKNTTFEVPSTGEYFISYYSYHSSQTAAAAAQTVTVERTYIRDMKVMAMAHVFPSAIDTDVKGFIDGTEKTLADDGAVALSAGGWTYHTLTFKTRSALSDEQYVLFRLMPGVVTGKLTNTQGQSDVNTTSHGLTYAEICMPKLEEGMLATGYIPSNKDLKGDRGPALRGPQNWEDVPVGFQFQAGGDNDLFFDTVIYKDNYYSCHKDHTKTDGNFPNSTLDQSQGLWKLGDKFDIVATKLLLATYALIRNLGVEAVDMKDSEGNILFQVKDGDVVCKTGTFENVTIKGKLKGSVRNPFVAAGDSFDTDYSDNVVLISEGGGWVNGYSLPWDVGQSGRHITLVNYKWGDVLSQGVAGISAPSGKYFYMNGIQKTTLNISREAVELLGYGTTTEFYGWIVLRRIDLVTTYRYGRELKALALGTVTGNNSGASISYKTFDGSALSVSRQGVGIYKITMPSGWFASAADCRVILTGVGGVFDNPECPVKATLYSRSTTDIIVHTSDDDSKNDGTFDFIISNGNDWTI